MQLALVWSEPLVGVSAAALPSGRAGAGARGRWRAREAARTALVSSLGTSASAMAKRKRFFAAALGKTREEIPDNQSSYTEKSTGQNRSLPNITPVGCALIQCCPPPLPPNHPLPPKALTSTSFPGAPSEIRCGVAR